MLSKAVFIVTLLASSVRGFSIPPGQPDGVYMVTTDVEGHDKHTKLSSLSTREASPVSRLVSSAKFFRRDVAWQSITCGDGPNRLNQEDTDSANGSLEAQCGSGALVPKNHNFYSIAGGTVSYFCNNGGDTRCFSWEKQQSERDITATCGAYYSGWAVRDTETWYGYQSIAGNNFCCGKGTNC